MTEASTSKKIIFKNKQGIELAASIELPAGKPTAFAIFAHCFTCSKDTLAAYRISKALTEFGIAVLRFDFTGLGNSQGDFANTNFSSNIQDLISANQFLTEAYQEPTLLIGHSLGGAAVLAVAPQLPAVKAIVTIEAPSDLIHLEHFFGDKIPEIKSEGNAEVILGGRKFNIQHQFLKDLEAHHLLDIVASLNKSLLVFHSPVDEIVSIENAYAIFAAAKGTKSFISLDGANHLLTQKKDSMYVANVLAAWASRYIATELDMADAVQADTSAQVIVRETKAGPFTKEIISGIHVFTADEPAAYGGNNLGPGPYDLLLAGLGACTSMTIRMYANMKKIPLDDVVVKLNHNKVHAKDCQNCENDQSKIDRIDREIALHGNLTPEQRQKLFEIANKCPVHKTLTSKIEIETTLKT